MRLGTTHRRHTRSLAGVGFTQAGTAAVTAQVDGVVRLWSPDTGQELRAFNLMGDDARQGHDRSLRDVAISPEGDVLAGVGFALDPAKRRVVQRIWIFDLKQNRLHRVIDTPSIDLYCLAYAARWGNPGDGRLRRRSLDLGCDFRQ